MRQRLVAAIEFVLKDIGHGHHLGRGIGDGYRLGSRPAAPATGTNNGHLDRITGLLAQYMWNGNARQSGDAGGFHEGASRFLGGFLTHACGL